MSENSYNYELYSDPEYNKTKELFCRKQVLKGAIIKAMSKGEIIRDDLVINYNNLVKELQDRADEEGQKNG